jgi:ribosomal protein L7/L12
MPKIKAWMLWLFSAICFLLSGIIKLKSAEKSTGIISIILAVSYVFLSMSNYKKDKKTNEIEVSETELENLDIELRRLIAEGKQIKAIKKYRMITGIGLKEAKEYIDNLI